MSRVTALLLGIAILYGSTPSVAQAASGFDELAEVVVSAARTPQRRLEYSGSIDRISAAELALLGAQHYAEALNRVPGVLIQRGSGQESLLAIRSPVLAGAGACGSFLILEDGLPTRPTGFCNVNELFELNTDQAGSIEILRGAAPVLYGANAVHGIVNVTTPGVADLHPGSVALESGTDDWRRLRVSAAASPALGFYGSVNHDGGWRAESATDEAKLNVLGDHDLGGGLLRLRASATVLNQETAGFIRGLDAYRNTALSRSNANPEAFRDAWSARLAAHWTGVASARGQTEIAALLRRSRMQFLQHFLLGKPLERNAQLSALLSLSRRSDDASAVRWGAGADLEWATGDLLEIQSGPTLEGSAAARAIRPAGRHYDYAVRAETVGGWLSGELALSSRLVLGVDLRADHTTYAYDNRMRSGNTDEAGLACAFGGCLYSRPADRSDRFSNFSPKLHLRYAASAANSIYGVVARGFRPPETTELYRLQRQQSVAQLRSELLDSAELGWVGSSAALRWSFAAWAMRKDNVILRDSNGFNVSNGRTRHVGVEYEFSWRFAPHWQLALAGTEARHRYDFSLAIDGGETITSGRDIDTAPREVQTLRVGYAIAQRLQAEFEVLRVGPYFADAANLARYPGHTLANLRFAISLAERWQLSARINNVTAAHYADRADFAQGDYRYFPGRGRSVFVQLQWQNH